MKPCIDGTTFGSITVNGTVFDHDVIIRPDGRVKKRRKKLSKAVYGTSHTISRQEARYVYEHADGADRLIVGSGQPACTGPGNWSRSGYRPRPRKWYETCAGPAPLLWATAPASATG